jgi:hypothetical protein
MAMTREEHFDPRLAPKRILALDGGGVRGVLTLEYLEVIERMLAERAGRADFRLCDYFDLIGGTSTGSVIAASLACGMSVAELKTLYRELGTTVFQTSFFRRGILAPKFPSEPVQRALDTHLGADVTLDSDRIRTGLMIMTKRLDTGSPWPLHNHPDAVYAKQDGKLLLTQIVRASTAAPTYFEPEVISISSRAGDAVRAAFVDGGVSPFNDPALQLLMVAALQGHGFRWQTGADKLLLVSIGTGTYRQSFPTDDLLKMATIEQGLRSLQTLMDDCARVNHALLQWLTNCVTPWTIDRAVGDMKLDSERGPRLATYARYNALLDTKWLETQVAIDCAPERVAKIAAMDNPAGMDELAEIGAKAAAKQVKSEHFDPRFDVSR